MPDGVAQALDVFFIARTDKVLRISRVALRWVDQIPQEIFVNDRLRVASALLCQLITRDQGKDLRARLPEVRHCIDLADLLIGLCETSSPAGAENVIVSDDNFETSDGDLRDTPALSVPTIAKRVYERRRASLQEEVCREPKKRH